ncbi:aspartate/glutamate racemase family protein [Geopsychrobacter electrodiphilus]|uniref:aspartate/glutamate racemase family protein n=1 Tax=Geopsychrobacter electrodiphilus TaxID=225196 RepID=UPI00037F7F86|nr:aspartate/glutamate racemase family protein [Geopsychrobacter electrodiphilus]
MLFQARKNQTSYGEAIGILLLDSGAPFIQGDVGNATTYDFPVRFKRIDGLTVPRIFAHDQSFIQKMVDGARELEREGVKAITGDCGFMAIYQTEVSKAVDIPVLLSSLLQIPFIKATLPASAKIGILTANSKALTPEVFERLGINARESLVISGMENCENFRAAAIAETGELDSDKIRTETVERARELVIRNPGVRSILLECSLMPPYSEAVQGATGLPVYDYITMINHAYSAIKAKHYADTM